MDLLITLLRFSAPLGFAALGETINQKSGVLNIGLEGMMLTGAYASVVVALDTGSAFAGIGAGIVAAILAGILQAWFVLKLAADQVVIGTAVNLLAMGVTATLYRARFGASGALVSAPKLPFWQGLDPILPSLIILPLAAWWVFKKTSWGLAVRASGEYPDAVEASGFNVLRLRFQVQIIASGLAGLAGSYLSVGLANSFAENMTAGRGFVALALVTFGRWKPVWVAAAALLVGAAEQAQFEMQVRGVALPTQLLTALPYLAALAVLIVAGRGTAAPDALGRPFRRLK